MKKVKYPKYSVLMSVYYKENPEWLKISIDSMLKQTVLCSEFVLIKDGKLTKELNEVIAKFNDENPKLFKIIELNTNVGLGPALKLGVENCSNEYIARMDSDDYSFPTRIEEEFKIFLNDEKIEIVGTNVSEFIGTIDNVISDVILPEQHEDIVKFSKRRNPFRHPSIMFKKSAVIKAGNYREYYLCEDYDMWVRMIRNNSKCYNIQKKYVYMRISDDFYKRRGGIKYLKSILKFKKEQLDVGYFTKREYLKSTIPHIVVCLLPNGLRDLIYKKLLRKKGKKSEKN